MSGFTLKSSPKYLRSAEPELASDQLPTGTERKMAR